MQTLYDLLQVRPDASPEVIVAAFRALAKRNHPDVNKAADANSIMTEIYRAYNILSDPVARAEYDRLLSTQQVIRPDPQPTPYQRSEEIAGATQATQRERESTADVIYKQRELSRLSAGFWRAIWIIVIIGIVIADLRPQFASYQPTPEGPTVAPARKSDLPFPPVRTPAPPTNLESRKNLQKIPENKYFNSLKRAYPDFESLRDTGEIMAWIKTKPEPERSALIRIYNQETTRDGRFILYNNGTVLDMWTNLMWAARDNGGDMNWQSAKSYCEKYRGGGYTDWRMPTRDELAGLFDERKTYRSACDTDAHLTELIRLSCYGVWASETRLDEAANFYFNYGDWFWYHQSNEYNSRVLPVRSGK